MKSSLSISIVGVAALILAQPVQAGSRGGGGGGRSFGGGAHFSGASRGYSGGARYGGGARYSSGAYSRGYYGAGPRYTAAMAGGARYSSVARFRNPTYNASGRQFGVNRTGAYAGNRNSRFSGNQTTAYNSVTRTRNGATMTNGVRSSRFNPNGQNVIARHSANWHSNWNTHSDHHLHGHTCHFFNGFWYVYDPFWYGYPYWYDYYPYEAYYDPGYDQGPYQDNGTSQDNKDHQYSQDPSANNFHTESGGRVTEVQRALAREGYYDGAVDGVMGAGTRRALRNYQRDHGLDATGGITEGLIEALRLR